MHRAAGSRPNPVSIVVADDHPLLVAGIMRHAERCGIDVLACCADGRSALAAIVEHEPDVAVLDLRMPELGGLEVLGEVRRLKLSTRVLVCSELSGPATVHALIAGGARGFVAKTAPVAELYAAVRRVAAGGVWLRPELQARVIARVARGERPPSPRELEVIRLVAEGLTDRLIGLRMHISHETVRTNLKRAQEKLGVSGRAALVAAALRLGLIE